jgi:hypothetical protein
MSLKRKFDSLFHPIGEDRLKKRISLKVCGFENIVDCSFILVPVPLRVTQWFGLN